MSNFAIKGHSTRGKEIIEILQMFGGINKYNITYTEDNLWYCLRSKDNVIIATYPNSSIKTVLSLEEFLEKFPYKLNELVLCDNGLLGIITKMEWNCEKSDMRYHISFNTPVYNKWYFSKNIKCKFMDEKDKKLAIKGHANRGKEVIEILKMLGGTNRENCWGIFENRLYLINDFGYIEDRSLWDNSNYHIYTLEEFEEKFPYKVGDKVTLDKFPCEIKGMSWEYDDIIYYVEGADFSKGVYSKDKDLQPYKEETMESKPNILQQLKEYFDNTPRDVLEKEWNELSYLNEIGPTVDEYLELVKKYRQSNQYPKTYEECCEVLLLKPERATYSVSGLEYKRHLIVNLQRLLICRNAYWKIYGERIGLGKSWEPNWKDTSQSKHSIWFNNEGICIKSNRISYAVQHILTFPTAEMRDSFYENFKVLIENCKELL